MLAADADDTFVILVRHMEGDRGRHLLLNKAKTLLHGIVRVRDDVDVEVLLAKSVEHDVDAA